MAAARSNTPYARKACRLNENSLAFAQRRHLAREECLSAFAESSRAEAASSFRWREEAWSPKGSPASAVILDGSMSKRRVSPSASEGLAALAAQLDARALADVPDIEALRAGARVVVDTLRLAAGDPLCASRVTPLVERALRRGCAVQSSPSVAALVAATTASGASATRLVLARACHRDPPFHAASLDEAVELSAELAVAESARDAIETHRIALDQWSVAQRATHAVWCSANAVASVRGATRSAALRAQRDAAERAAREALCALAESERRLRGEELLSAARASCRAASATRLAQLDAEHAELGAALAQACAVRTANVALLRSTRDVVEASGALVESAFSERLADARARSLALDVAHVAAHRAVWPDLERKRIMLRGEIAQSERHLATIESEVEDAILDGAMDDAEDYGRERRRIARALGEKQRAAERLRLQARGVDLAAAPAYAATRARHPWIEVIADALGVVDAKHGGAVRRRICAELRKSPRTPPRARSALANLVVNEQQRQEVADGAVVEEEEGTPTSVAAVSVVASLASIAKCLTFDDDGEKGPFNTREEEVAGEGSSKERDAKVEEVDASDAMSLAARRIAQLLPEHLAVAAPATMREFAAARVAIVSAAITAASDAAAAATARALDALAASGHAWGLRAASDAATARGVALVAALAAAASAGARAEEALSAVAREARFLRLSTATATAPPPYVGVFKRNAVRGTVHGAPVYTRERNAATAQAQHLYRGSDGRWCVDGTVSLIAGTTFAAALRSSAPADAPIGADWSDANLVVDATTEAAEAVLRPITLSGHTGAQRARCMGSYAPHPYYRSPKSNAIIFTKVDDDNVHLHRAASGQWFVSGTTDALAGNATGWLHSVAAADSPLSVLNGGWHVFAGHGGWRTEPRLVVRSSLVFDC